MIVIFVLSVLGFGFYFSHIIMTLNYCDKFGFGTFKKFKNEYAKKEWSRSPLFLFSHFVVYDSEIHAGIIRFDNKGMLFLPLGFFRLHLWLWRNRRKRKRKRNRLIKWG